MDEKKKQQTRARYLRGQKKMVGYEEEKRRRADSSRRRQGQTGDRQRRRDWDADDDDLEAFESFEKIRKRKDDAATPHRRTVDTAGMPRAIVAAVHQGRVQLDNGETARLAGHLVVDPEFRVAVGDEVAFSETDGPPRIEALEPRRSCLSRPDPGNPHRPLVIAANVDVGVIVVAAKEPPLRPGLIDRLMLALAHGGVPPVVCVNKLDLLDATEHAELTQTLAPYVELGLDVFGCAAATGDGIEALREHLTGRTCVFVGHSGVGKSSLLNALDPEGERRTGDVRDYDGRGRHTTTASSLRVLDDGTRVIDTPGVRSFGLDDLDPEQVRDGFPEFAPFARACRFADCSHIAEPSCGVRSAVETGELSADRFASYRRILEDP